MKKKSGKASELEKKKAIVLNQPASKAGRFKPIVVMGAAAVILAILTVGHSIWKKNLENGPPEKTGGIQAQLVEADQVLHPVSLFEDGKARHFDFTAQGKTIRYFIIKSADGVIRAAFDACDVCWRAGKGYSQDGDDMVCGNCGRRFASNLVNEIQGGCNPAPLSRIVKGDSLIIRKADLIKGQFYFNL